MLQWWTTPWYSSRGVTTFDAVSAGRATQLLQHFVVLTVPVA